MPSSLHCSQNEANDQGWDCGFDMDNVRWTMNPPIPDDSIEYFQKTRTGIGAALMPSFQVFGSPHPTGCQFVLLDGSVHMFGCDADQRVSPFGKPA